MYSFICMHIFKKAVLGQIFIPVWKWFGIFVNKQNIKIASFYYFLNKLESIESMKTITKNLSVLNIILLTKSKKNDNIKTYDEILK